MHACMQRSTHRWAGAGLNVMQVGGVKVSPKGEFGDLCESKGTIYCIRIAQKAEAAPTFHTLPAFEASAVGTRMGRR